MFLGLVHTVFTWNEKKIELAVMLWCLLLTILENKFFERNPCLKLYTFWTISSNCNINWGFWINTRRPEILHICAAFGNVNLIWKVRHSQCMSSMTGLHKANFVGFWAYRVQSALQGMHKWVKMLSGQKYYRK